MINEKMATELGFKADKYYSATDKVNLRNRINSHFNFKLSVESPVKLFRRHRARC